MPLSRLPDRIRLADAGGNVRLVVDRDWTLRKPDGSTTWTAAEFRSALRAVHVWAKDHRRDLTALFCIRMIHRIAVLTKFIQDNGLTPPQEDDV
jgi:hypothetical protein